MGKTIKEKAIIAFERDLEVVITPKVGCFYTPHDCCRIETLYQSGVKLIWSEEGEVKRQPMSYINIADIRFVDEPETKEEMIERGILLREATVDELGEENEELKATVSALDEKIKWWKSEQAKLERPAKTKGVFITDEAEVEKLRTTIADLEEDSQERIRKVIHYETRNAELTEQLMALEKTITELKERLTVAEADQEIVMECQAAPESLRQKLEHAKRHGYLVAVSWVEDKKTRYFSGTVRRIIDDITLSFREAMDIDLASVQSVDIVLGDMPTGKPDEPEDIAKQRWMIYKGVCGVEIRQICDGHEPSLALTRRGSLAERIEFVATDAQIKLIAAAPELADRLREAVEGGSAFEEDMPDVVKHIKFLRELGIPNVATWYKGESEDKAVIAPPQLDEIAKLLNENADLKKQIAAHDGAISVSGARKRMRDAFENDPEWKMTYVMNIEMLMYDILGSDNHGDRIGKQIAEKILDMVFEK